MAFYYQLFYSLYRYFAVVGRSNDPAFMSAAYLSLWSFLWLFNLISFLDLVGFRIHITNSKLWALLVLAPFFIVNYLLFVYKDRYLDIESNFNGSSPSIKTLNVWLSILLYLFPLLILSLLIYLHRVN